MGPVKFEIRRLLPSVGYIETSENTSCSAKVREQLSSWSAFFALAGEDVKELYGGSTGSVIAKKGDLDNSDLEDEYWVTTKGALYLLIFWIGHRRSAQDLVLSVLKLLTTAMACP